MADNNIVIGAVIDLNQILPGFQQLVTAAEATTTRIRATMNELSATPAGINVTAGMQAIREESLVVADLKVKLAALQAAMRETEAIFAEAGGSMNVATSIQKRYGDEQYAAGVASEQLAIAQRVLKQVIEATTEAEERAAATAAALAAANERAAKSAAEAAAAQELQAKANAEAVATAEAEAEATSAQAAANQEVVGTSAEAAAATDAQAVASMNAAKASETQTAATDAKTLAIVDAMKAFMAEGLTAEKAGEEMVKSGFAASAVAKALGVIKSEAVGASGGLAGVRTAALGAGEAQAGMGVTAAGAARSLQLVGASGRDIAQQLLAAGFSVKEISAAFNDLGIGLNDAANEELRVAKESGATREELERLFLTVKKNSEAFRQLSEDMRVTGASFAMARTEGAVLTGSATSMAMGLTRVAAASKVLGPLMAAAFPVFAAIAIVDILIQVAEGFGKATNAVIGYTEEVQKAYKEDVKASQAAEVHAATTAEAFTKLQEQLRITAKLAGETWTDKALQGVDVANKQTSAWLTLVPVLAMAAAAYNDIAGSIKGVDDAANREVEALKAQETLHRTLAERASAEAKDAIELSRGSETIRKVGETRVAQLREEIAGLKERQSLEMTAAGNAAAAKPNARDTDVQNARTKAWEVSNNEILERQKQLGVAELELSLATQRAVADGEKTIGLARITQREKLAQDMYKAGKVSLDQEINDEKTAANDKYQIDLANLQKRRSIAIAEKPAGKDTTPEIHTLDAEIEALEITHQTTLMNIEANGAEQRRRVNEEYHRAVVAGERELFEARSSLAKETARVQYDTNSISEAQYTKLLLDNEQARTIAAKAALEQQKADVEQYSKPEDRAAKMRAADDALEAEVIRSESNIQAIRAASQTRQNTDERKALEISLDAIAKDEERNVNAAEHISEERIRQIDRLAQYGLITEEQKAAMDSAEIERERQKVVAILQSALAQEEVARAAAKSSEAQEIADKKIIDLTDKITKAQDAAAEKQRRITDDLYDGQVQKAQQSYNVIGAAFNSAFDKMTTEHTKFLKVMQNFWNQIVQGWEKIGLQIVATYVQALAKILIQELLTALKIQLIHTQTTTAKQATENLWTSILTALGIKHATQAQATDGAESASHTAAVTHRQTIDQTAAAHESLQLQAGLAQFKLTQTAETAILQIAVNARNAIESQDQSVGSPASSAKAIAKVDQDIGQAGADVFSQAIASIPFPANIAAAPALAATTVAQMAPFAAMVAGGAVVGSAAKGALLDTDGMVAAHAKELILPGHISMGLQNAIATGAPAFAAPQALAAGGAGGTGGPGGAAGVAGAPGASGSGGSVTHNHNYHSNIEYHSHGSTGIQKEELAGLIRQSMRRGSLG